MPRLSHALGYPPGSPFKHPLPLHHATGEPLPAKMCVETGGGGGRGRVSGTGECVKQWEKWASGKEGGKSGKQV